MLVLNAGGTIGMGPDANGALAPIPVGDLIAHARPTDDAGFGVTFASFRRPLDSSRMRPADWITIADAIVALAPGHTGIVVLHGNAVVGAYEDAFDLLRMRVGAVWPRTVNLITGPSRTADIEQTLIMGAHGPRRLHVILVEDQTA